MVVVEGKRVSLPAGCSAVEKEENIAGEAEETEEGDVESFFKENEETEYGVEKQKFRGKNLRISK